MSLGALGPGRGWSGGEGRSWETREEATAEVQRGMMGLAWGGEHRVLDSGIRQR